MNFEKIEQAYDLLLENVQLIQNNLATNFYDALIEQNAIYLDGETSLEKVKENQKELKALNLTAEEWRRAYQFLFIKAAQTEPLQANHQFTPDSIGFILNFMLEELVSTDPLEVLEIGSGTGNLALTLVNHSSKQMDYLGLELDDLLIDLSASIAEVIQAPLSFVRGDAVRPQVLKESDVIISDLPIGYYPEDSIAMRFDVASKSEHTYAHHLLMEQSLKYLKPDGYAMFLAPNDLLTSPQSHLLKEWLKKQAQLVAMIALPENLFGSHLRAKSIFVLKKQEKSLGEAFVYPLKDLQNQHEMMQFVKSFQNWVKDSEK